MKVTKRSWKSWVLCLSLSLFSSQFAFAQFDSANENANASNPEDMRNYYTFDEGNSSEDLSWKDPMDLLTSEGASLMDAAATSGVSLLHWVLHDDPPPAPVEPYKRKEHFGGWRGDPSHETCYNTRARILMRDSKRAVTYSGKRNCTVNTGLWKDPYTGNLFESARQIQIDHMVPLKNAYISGAAAWTPKHRCTYANFTANNYHLISASGHENMSKGDDTPADYLPPDEGYVCTDLKHWMMVKMTWQLFMSDSEVRAITAALKEHRCNNSAMKIEKTELRNMRIAMRDESACTTFGVPRDPKLPSDSDSSDQIVH